MDGSPTESLHRALLEENRVLKELLKQAVKREGEALRKLTHLSKLVKSRPDGTTGNLFVCVFFLLSRRGTYPRSVIALGLYSGGSSSDPEPDDGENFTNGKSEIGSCATPTEVRLSLERRNTLYSVIITIHRTTFYCPRVLQDKKLNTGMHIYI